MVVRNNTERSLVLCSVSPLITSCETVVQHHKQNIDTDVVKIQNIPITINAPQVVLLQPHPFLPGYTFSLIRGSHYSPFV